MVERAYPEMCISPGPDLHLVGSSSGWNVKPKVILNNCDKDIRQ